MNRPPYHKLLFALAVLATMMSCTKELKPATVVVKDPVRHYYPVIQGETLGVTYQIENTSDNPLFIREVQTTCGCVVPRDELPIVVLPKKSGFVHLDFNTIKNNGYVCHWVYCYGNFKDTTCVELQFDTNVVPSADYIRDYEQLWHEQSIANHTLRDYVDGLSSQKGYYTDELIDPRAQENEQHQDAFDDIAP